MRIGHWKPGVRPRRPGLASWAWLVLAAVRLVLIVAVVVGAYVARGNRSGG